MVELDQKHSLVGWIFDEDNGVHWTKVFDINVSFNSRFGNVPSDSFVDGLVKCDLYGYVKEAFRSNRDMPCFDNYLDVLFIMFGCNLKSSFNERHKILFNEEPMFVKDLSKDIAAQITVIDSAYWYFNMTTYSFWETSPCALKMISSKFKCTNLGGWLVKIGQFPEVDAMLKEKMLIA